jgi:hypothetical protein
MRSAFRISFVLVLSFALCSCLAPGANAPKKAPTEHTALLVPPAFHQQLNSQMTAELPNVTQSVGRILHRARHEVVLPSDSLIAESWKKASREAGFRGSYDPSGEKFDAACSALARVMAETVEFDVLVVTLIERRTAVYAGSGGRWDGVTRQTKIYDMGNLGSTSINRISQAGDATEGISLHILTFSPAGEKLSDGRGGIELVQAVRVTPDFRFQFLDREDLLRDKANLRDAASVALKPYFLRES